MTYSAKMEKGEVVFEGPAKPRDGVRLTVIEQSNDTAKVGEGLERLAGKAVGLPADLAEKHDQYRREKQGL